MMYPLNDSEWYESTIISATHNGIHWYVSSDLGSMAFDAIPENAVGKTIRYYGKGLGYTVRGVFIDGVCIYYTPKKKFEEEERFRQAYYSLSLFAKTIAEITKKP